MFRSYVLLFLIVILIYSITLVIRKIVLSKKTLLFQFRNPKEYSTEIEPFSINKGLTEQPKCVILNDTHRRSRPIAVKLTTTTTTLMYVYIMAQKIALVRESDGPF